MINCACYEAYLNTFIDFNENQLKSSYTGFPRVREKSGNFKFFQGQGKVREKCFWSGNFEVLPKCQGKVRELFIRVKPEEGILNCNVITIKNNSCMLAMGVHSSET